MTDVTVDTYHLHLRRVRWAALATMLVGFVVFDAGLAWMTSKALLCWNDRSGEVVEEICEWSFLAPDVIWGAMALVFGGLVAALYGLGQHNMTDLDDAKRSRTGRAVHRTRNAYHGLENRHRRGVKAAAVSLMWCSGIFAGVVAWYLLEVPPLAGLLCRGGHGAVAARREPEGDARAEAHAKSWVVGADATSAHRCPRWRRAGRTSTIW